MMIELPKKQYNQVHRFDDFDEYHDDDDNDEGNGEMGNNGESGNRVSTNVLHSNYVRPRDYRIRRLFTSCRWILGGGLVAIVVVIAYMSGASSSNNSSNSNATTDNGLPSKEGAPLTPTNSDNKPEYTWGELDESEEQEIERKPIPNDDESNNGPVAEVKPEDGLSSAAQEGLNQHDSDSHTTSGEHTWFEDEDEDDDEEEVEEEQHEIEQQQQQQQQTKAAVETASPDPAPTEAPTAAQTDTDLHTNPGEYTWMEDEPKPATGSPKDGGTPVPPNDDDDQQQQQQVDNETSTIIDMEPPAANAIEQTDDPTSGPTEKEKDDDIATPVPTNAAKQTDTPTSGPTENQKDDDIATPAPTAFKPVAAETVPYHYQLRRGISLTLHEQSVLAQKWGSWTLVDKKAAQRPRFDYCGPYPNRDIPWDKFPRDAWQTDVSYLGEFLAQGKDLVRRAMEVHLAEYGFGPDDLPEDSFLDRTFKSPFRMEILDHYSDDPETRRRLSGGVDAYSGWTTQKSFDGLVRRLLHAVVSKDSFNMVLGGHSAAAGHGNHFQQSYALQFQRVMEPVFARLGVKHYSRNTGMGGLGTIQSAMGAQDIYGRDVDILIWDSGMTESAASADFDMFARQGILGSDRAPLLWAGGDDLHVYPALQEHADVDYMMYGLGLGPIPEVTDPTTVGEIPWAARYLKCDSDWLNLCRDNKFNGTCWIERPDNFEPPTAQKGEPGGRASWHDGNRMHQLYGRTMSFSVLRALYEALELWDQQPDKTLKDDMWHVSAYYKNIKTKVANLDPDVGTCQGIEGRLPTEFCTLPFQARTEFTPRANPAETSLRSIMKPAGPDVTVPEPRLNLYDAPDVFNPVLGVPKGEVDYLAIIENGNVFLRFQAPAPLLTPLGSSNRLIQVTADESGESIVPGIGWGINTKSSPHMCNGTYDSFCGRSEDEACLLYAHNDYRGGMTFDSLSGWGIFTIKNLKEGMIYVKMDSWRKAKDNPVTEGWTAVNNGTRTRTLLSASHSDDEVWLRGLKVQKDDPNAVFCDDFKLEFAFGDTIISLDKDEVLGDRHSLVQRVVQLWTVLNDRDFTEGETVDIELGIRMSGCARDHVFWLTHIYWA